LILVVGLGLAERKATLPAHPLRRPDLFDRLLESGEISLVLKRRKEYN
jgi:hypothetical protein